VTVEENDQARRTLDGRVKELERSRQELEDRVKSTDYTNKEALIREAGTWRRKAAEMERKLHLDLDPYMQTVGLSCLCVCMLDCFSCFWFCTFTCTQYVILTSAVSFYFFHLI